MGARDLVGGGRGCGRRRGGGNFGDSLMRKKIKMDEEKQKKWYSLPISNSTDQKGLWRRRDMMCGKGHLEKLTNAGQIRTREE